MTLPTLCDFPEGIWPAPGTAIQSLRYPGRPGIYLAPSFTCWWNGGYGTPEESDETAGEWKTRIERASSWIKDRQTARDRVN